MSLHSTGRRSIPPPALEQGRYLESRLPLVGFAALTHPHRASRLRWDTLLKRWLEGLQAHSGVTLGWIRAYEPQPQLHAHVALVAARAIDCDGAARLWQQGTGARDRTAGLIEPFQFGIDGLGYILKSLGSEAEDISYSPNLTAFALSATLKHYGRSSAERRQIRRIQQQALSTFR